HTPPLSTLFPYTTLFRSLNGKTFPQTVPAYDSLGVIITLNPTRYASEQSTLHFPFKRSTDPKSFDLSVSLFGTGTKPVLTTPDTDRKSTRLNSSHVAISY